MANSSDSRKRRADVYVDCCQLVRHFGLGSINRLSHLLTAAAEVQSGDGGRSDCWAQCELQVNTCQLSHHTTTHRMTTLQISPTLYGTPTYVALSTSNILVY